MSIVKCSYKFNEVKFEALYHFIIAETDSQQTPSSIRQDKNSIESDTVRFAMSSYAVWINNIGIPSLIVGSDHHFNEFLSNWHPNRWNNADTPMQRIQLVITEKDPTQPILTSKK